MKIGSEPTPIDVTNMNWKGTKATFGAQNQNIVELTSKCYFRSIGGMAVATKAQTTPHKKNILSSGAVEHIF
jgi:hypothetical protein